MLKSFIIFDKPNTINTTKPVLVVNTDSKAMIK